MSISCCLCPGFLNAFYNDVSHTTQTRVSYPAFCPYIIVNTHTLLCTLSVNILSLKDVIVLYVLLYMQSPPLNSAVSLSVSVSG